MRRSLPIPDTIHEKLTSGAHRIVNVSGGKDSDAMLTLLWDAYRQQGWQGDFCIVTCDLGRSEWDFSLPHIHAFAREITGLSVDVLRRPQGDLLDQWWTRYRTLQAEGRGETVPPWSSAAARFCTKAQKEAQVNKYIIRHYPHDATIISCIGIRAEESPARRRKSVVQPYTRSPTAPTKRRQVLRWLPIHDFTLREVWQTLGWSLERLAALQAAVRSTVQPGDREALYQLLDAWHYRANPVYALGNDRCSCRLCVLGNKNDLRNGIVWNPDHYRDLVELELTSGFSFQPGRWLADMYPNLLSDDQQHRLAQMRGNDAHPPPTQLTFNW